MQFITRYFPVFDEQIFSGCKLLIKPPKNQHSIMPSLCYVQSQLEFLQVFCKQLYLYGVVVPHVLTDIQGEHAPGTGK